MSCIACLPGVHQYGYDSSVPLLPRLKCGRRKWHLSKLLKCQAGGGGEATLPPSSILHPPYSIAVAVVVAVLPPFLIYVSASLAQQQGSSVTPLFPRSWHPCSQGAVNASRIPVHFMPSEQTVTVGCLFSLCLVINTLLVCLQDILLRVFLPPHLSFPCSHAVPNS